MPQLPSRTRRALLLAGLAAAAGGPEMAQATTPSRVPSWPAENPKP